MSLKDSQKRRLSESSEIGPSSSKIRDTTHEVTGEDHCTSPAHPVLHNTHRADSQTGHRYAATVVSDYARVQLGDVHAGVVNYNIGQLSHEESKDKELQDFIEALEFDSMDLRLAAIAPADNQTCHWVFESPEYVRWRDQSLQDSHNGLLWIKGKAGAGKSTIMKLILERLKETYPEDCVISFFFNARGVALERSVEGMYRTLLCHLLRKFPRLRTVLTMTQMTKKGQRWDIGILRDLFRKAILGLENDRLICLVDALDEGNQEDIRDMIKFFGNLAQMAKSRDMHLEFCYASRHYPNISVRACESIMLDDTQEHKRDVYLYIMNNLTADVGILQRLQLELWKKSQGVFLWVVLVVRRLNEAFDDGKTQDELLEITTTVPEGLNNLLHDIVIRESADERLLIAIMWVMFAPNGINLRELYFAIRFIRDKSHTLPSSEQDDTEEFRSTMSRFICSASKGLVEVTWPEPDLKHLLDRMRVEEAYEFQDQGYDEYKVMFIHESVREYFLDRGLATLCPDLTPNVAAGGHSKMAHWCQLYIQSFSLIYDTISKDSPELGYETQVTIDWLPLLRYVAEETFWHMAAAFELGNPADAVVSGFPLQQSIKLLNYHSFPTIYPPATSFLFLLIQKNCLSLAEAHFEQWITSLNSGCYDETPLDGEIPTQGSAISAGETSHMPCERHEYSQILAAAAAAGNNGLLRLVLDHGADENLQIRDTQESLARAIDNRRHDTVRFLLDRGATTNAHSDGLGCPVGIAIKRHDCKMLKLLLDRGANVDAQITDEEGAYSDPVDAALQYSGEPGVGDPRRDRDPQLKTLQVLCEHDATMSPEQLSKLSHLAARDDEKSPKGVYLDNIWFRLDYGVSDFLRQSLKIHCSG